MVLPEVVYLVVTILLMEHTVFYLLLFENHE